MKPEVMPSRQDMPKDPGVLARQRAARELELMGQYTREQRTKAMLLFLSDNVDPVTIGLQLGLPTAVVTMFAEEDRWVERRKELETKLVDLAAQAELKLIMEERPQVIRRHLDAAKKLSENASTLANDAVAQASAHKLKSAAEALRIACDIEARVVGLGDSVGSEQKGGKITINTPAPVILVGKGPRTPNAFNTDSDQPERHEPRATQDVQTGLGTEPAAFVEGELVESPGEQVRQLRGDGGSGVRSHPRDQDVHLVSDGVPGQAAPVPGGDLPGGDPAAVRPVQPEEGRPPAS